MLMGMDNNAEITSMIRLKKHQAGMSLVGLMIGMLLSTLGLLAATNMYHSMVEVAIDTKIDAQHDGQLASAMLTVQLELQNAGFGIESAATADHLQVTDTNILDWRSQLVAGVYTCRRLIYINDSLLLQDGSNCGAGPNFAGVNWSTLATLAVFNSANTSGAPEISFEANTEECYPFGRTTSAVQRGRVTILAESAASRATNGNIALSEYKFCLPNLT